jgi:hypothetical protein
MKISRKTHEKGGAGSRQQSDGSVEVANRQVRESRVTECSASLCHEPWPESTEAE